MLRLALLIGLLGQSEPPAPDDYSVTEIDSAIPAEAVVGPLRSGLACLPAGKLRWNDIARGRERALIKTGQRVLADAGLGAAPAPDGPFQSELKPERGRYHVALTVRQFVLKLCVAWKGLGVKPKGKGAVTIGIAVLDTASNVRLPDREMVIDLDLRGRDPRRDESVLSDAIAEAMRRFVATRASPS